MATRHYRARWIIPVGGSPIRDGVISVDNGRIVEVTRASKEQYFDLGDAVIIPALVNAHTHLEFSNLQSPLGAPEMPFTEWIKRVVAWRRKRDDGWDQARGASPAHVSSIRKGLRESIRIGATLLGEIATVPESANFLEDSFAGGVAFWEMIGWSAASIADNLERAHRFLANRPPIYFTGVIRGVSPHAPYTVHQDLLRETVDESARYGFPLAMHLAETEAELQLLANGNGPFAEMLQTLDAWEPSAFIANSRPLHYLQILSKAARAIIVHGNYLDQREIDFLGQHRANMSIVYCPRTHHYFGHRKYSLEQMLAAGVRVALGTDSRASNPDLNLWKEVRFGASRHPNIAPETWLRMATLNGAEALGIDRDYGSLVPGKSSNFLVVPLSASETSDPWSWVHEGWQPLIYTNKLG